MHHITLVCVGGLKSSWLKEGCADYAARLSRQCRFEVTDLPPSKATDALRQREEESEALLRHLEKRDGALWVLDERGKERTSVELSEDIAALRDAGTPLILLIGGAHGFDEHVRAKADRVLALGTLTLPHELTRLLLLEQLYRAHEIARGSGYHHS